MSAAVIHQYYDAFNRGDREAMLSLLTEDVAHDINQGGRETGKDAFRRFMGRMNQSYAERLADIVVMTSADGQRAAAEYVVHGTYLATDEGLPEAKPLYCARPTCRACSRASRSSTPTRASRAASAPRSGCSTTTRRSTSGRCSTTRSR